jgi:hypothetical protein
MPYSSTTTPLRFGLAAALWLATISAGFAQTFPTVAGHSVPPLRPVHHEAQQQRGTPDKTNKHAEI